MENSKENFTKAYTKLQKLPLKSEHLNNYLINNNIGPNSGIILSAMMQVIYFNKNKIDVIIPQRYRKQIDFIGAYLSGTAGKPLIVKINGGDLGDYAFKEVNYVKAEVHCGAGKYFGNGAKNSEFYITGNIEMPAFQNAQNCILKCELRSVLELCKKYVGKNCKFYNIKKF
ncbi:MAG: hypothetical protein QXQ79_01090 [Candidatus Nanoarchaeia archaeon]